MQSNVTEIEGDLFNAPDGAALIHACNCQGSWGKGIAEAFRIRYPAAYAIYKAHCQNYLKTTQYHSASQADAATPPARRIQLPEGSALVIPPQKRDYESRRGTGKRHWVICLFTSRRFGRNVSGAEVILENTVLAVEDMKRQLEGLQADQKKSDGPGSAEEIPITGLWSCRFNSGLFGVDWALSRKILEESGLEVTVVSPPGE